MNTAEDANHYFLECPKYAQARREMTETFANLNIPCNIQNILHGSLDHNFEINKLLVDSIHSYIVLSNRF